MKSKTKNRWTAVLIALAGCTLTALLAIQDSEESIHPLSSPVLAVETLCVQKTDYRVRVPAWGIVEPKETIDVRPKVSGMVADVSTGLFTGGAVGQGAFLFSLDTRAFENSLAEATAAHEQARQALAIEQGRQTIAKSEWELLEGSNWQGAHNKPLALRRPHLKTCQAAVEMALARQSQAELDLEWTRFYAPCKGVILEESIAKGQVLEIGDVALRLACTDCYHVMASFSTGDVLDPKMQEAVVTIGSASHKGIIRTVLPRIDPQTRQKQTLVAFTGPGVALGAYAALTLPGPMFENCAVLPKAALRSGSSIWVLSENGTLDIRPVTVLAKDPRHVVIGEGLAEGENVILSHIASPLKGMPLRGTERRFRLPSPA